MHLSEIEAALRQLPAVRQAAVVAVAGEAKQLVAYVVPDGAVTTIQLRTALSEKLPAYMVPHHFILLEALPLTANGKIDRASLPVPELPCVLDFRRSTLYVRLV